MKKKYTKDEIVSIFNEVFLKENAKREKECISCAFKPMIFQFMDYNEETEVIKFKISESNTFSNEEEENGFSYDSQITLDDLIVRHNSN